MAVRLIGLPTSQGRPSVISGGGGGSPPAADFQETFGSYSSTANMIADPRGIYSTGEDVLTAQMALDKTVGYTAYGLTQSMRYDWPDRTSEGTTNGLDGYCGDYTIGRNLTLPSTQTNLYIELVMKTDSFFKTLAPAGWNCHSAAAYKLIFGRTDVSRFNFVPGIFGETGSYTLGYPGNEEPADYPLTDFPSNPFDGNWHKYGMHFKMGSGNGICSIIQDGTMVKQLLNTTTSGSDIYGIALGRNMNQGPAAPQSLWWGCVSAWYTSTPSWAQD